MNKRHIVLFGIATSLLLAVPGCSRKDEKKDVAPAAVAGMDKDVLVTVDGKPVLTVEEFKKFVKEAAESDQQIQFMLQIMPDFEEQLFEYAKLREIQLAQLALDEKFATDAEFLKQKAQAEKALTNMLNHKLFVKRHVKDVAESEAQKYYQEHKDKDHTLLASPAGVKAKAVIFNKEDGARAFLAMVEKNHGAFDAKAKELKKTVDNLGVVGATSMLDPIVRDKIAALKSLPIVVMVKAHDNEYWVILASGRQTAQYRPFEQVKEAVKETLMRERVDQAFKTELPKLLGNRVSVNRAYFEQLKKEREAQRAKMMEQKKAEDAKKGKKVAA